MKQVWGYTNPHILILATPGFIVFLDEVLDVDWKSTPEWDEKIKDQRAELRELLNVAAALEAGEWDQTDIERTIKFRRQIAESIASGLEGNFRQAKQMLEKADEYRKVVRRHQAIREQIKAKDEWRRCHRIWITIHYALGIGALTFSTLVASRIGFNDLGISLLAWLVALFTGLLTFLTPGKKADRYLRAWSTLNSQITRYNSMETYTLDDVLDAYQRGENIIFETSDERRKVRNTK